MRLVRSDSSGSNAIQKSNSTKFIPLNKQIHNNVMIINIDKYIENKKMEPNPTESEQNGMVEYAKQRKHINKNASNKKQQQRKTAANGWLYAKYLPDPKWRRRRGKWSENKKYKNHIEIFIVM